MVEGSCRSGNPNRPFPIEPKGSHSPEIEKKGEEKKTHAITEIVYPAYIFMHRR